MPGTGTQPATIGALLDRENVHLGVDAADKADLIEMLVGSLVTAEGSDLEQALTAVLARESELSTGVGDGVALPHAKTTAVSETQVLFATTRNPIDFESFDGEPVSLVFLMVGPPSSSTHHIRILGRVSRILNDENTRNELLGASTPEQVIRVFEAAEARLGVI